MKLHIALAAVPLKLARPYMKHFDRTRYAETFNKYGEGKGKDKFRIYIPLGEDHASDRASRIEPPQEIVKYLLSKGMVVDSYLAGTVFSANGKHVIRLGKVLSKEPKLLQMFNNDPQRRGAKLVKSWVVISRHPYDIIGMSFDRGWTSCMNLKDGINKHYLERDVKAGTLVAYIIKETDKNINAPVARIAIKPYLKIAKGVTQGMLLVPEGAYGDAPPVFEETIHKFCAYMNHGSPTGTYKIAKGLYDDSEEGEGVVHVNANEDVSQLDVKQRRKIAGLSTTSIQLLDQLSKDPDVKVRMAVAANNRAGAEACERLVNDPEAKVRVELTVREDPLPRNVVHTMAMMIDDPDMFGHSLYEQHFDKAWIPEMLALNLESECVLSLVNRFKLTTPQYRDLIKRDFSIELAKGVKVPTSILDEIVAGRTGNELPGALYYNVIRNRNLSQATLIRLFDPDDIDPVLRHPKCPIDLLSKYIDRADVNTITQYIEGVAHGASPMPDTELMDRICARAAALKAFDVFECPPKAGVPDYLNEKQANWLLDKSKNFADSLAWHTSFSDDFLLRLMNVSYFVREIYAENAGKLSDNVLRGLIDLDRPMKRGEPSLLYPIVDHLTMQRKPTPAVYELFMYAIEHIALYKYQWDDIESFVDAVFSCYRMLNTHMVLTMFEKIRFPRSIAETLVHLSASDEYRHLDYERLLDPVVKAMGVREALQYIKHRSAVGRNAFLTAIKKRTEQVYVDFVKDLKAK